MAKINHNNYLDTIDDIFSDAKKKGIMHLYTEGDGLIGSKLNIKGKELSNFGTCGYLGLELDERLKEGAIRATEKYGTQFSVSRGYVSTNINGKLEELISQMYGYPAMVFSSTSSCHISVIPTVIREGDAVILDQQVHMSVQTGTQLLRQKGIPIEMIRHSSLEMLERKIKELGDKYKKIWYMIDGVYSMYGDVAPMDGLIGLMNKYDQLHLYIDDAHGMSWYGKNGTGYIFGKSGMHEKMILITTLAKGFGVTGGIAVFPNEELCRKVKIFGGPFCYSHPLAPPMIGAAIASAEIHLSPEIYQMQDQLAERINYCNELLNTSNLSVISNPLTPIYFIGMGQPRVGHNMVGRLLNDGFYVNVSLFPTVPVKCTGLRFTITRHVSMEDIKALADAMVYHYPKVLEEERCTENDIRKAFKLPLIDKPVEKAETKDEYQVQYETSISAIAKTEWDIFFGANGSYDWNGMQFLEEACKNNIKPEENWDFHYYIIRDKMNKPLLATFFTLGIFKDDLLAPESVSKQIEEKRKNDPYYLVSLILTMGSLLSEGQHLYIDRTYSKWGDVVKLLLLQVEQILEKEGCSKLLLRDFDESDTELRDYFINEGFVKINMPNSNVIENAHWNTNDEFLQGLSSRNRRHIRDDVFKYEHFYEVEVKNTITDEEASHFYELYMNVKRRNFSVNLFDYPTKITSTMSKYPDWEFVVLKLKAEYDTRENRLPVAAMWCYKTATHYCPMVIGMDYDYVFTHMVYKQSLFQVVKRARQLGLSKVFLGLSADIEKRKYGAKQIAKVAYVQAKDNFNMEVIETMAAIEA